jgi:acetoin utilization deacetylase AcuC-like enzyme
MIVYSKSYLNHHMEGHPENRERLTSTTGFLEKKGVFEKIPLATAKKAYDEDILRVHSKEHLENMRVIANGGMKVLGDTYFTPATFDSALLAAGGVLTCLNDGVDKAFALVRPPGHHATRSAAMGFCIFNNVSVGASYARSKGYERIAILDFDLHHGNGTQDIFYHDDILYVSLHQWPHYPGTGMVEELGEGDGEGYTVNIPLPAGVSDRSYNRALDEVVYPVLEDFSPDVLFCSAGYDGHFSDPLGSLQLSSNTYFNIAEKLKNLAKKVVFSLEGGYNLDSLPHCVYASLTGLFDLEGEGFDEEQFESEIVTKHVEAKIKTIKERISEYWSI